MSKDLLLVDRSRSVTDWSCQRKRYLNYELDGKGIVSTNAPLELEMGTILHSGLARIAESHPSVDIDSVTHDAFQGMFTFLMKGVSGVASDYLVRETYAKEQATLVEGLLRGFYKHQWPRLMDQYPKILAIEQEMSYEYGSLLYMSKPDLVVADRHGEVAYCEYKSTSSKKEEWINSWDTAIQLHSTTRAIEAALNEKISHILVQGLYKSYLSYGKQSSPFCYAYRRTGTPPFSKDEISYEYKAGFKRYPVWEMMGGVKTWVESMPEAILTDQFPCTPPIFVNDDLVEAFFYQRNIREQEIQLGKLMLENQEDPGVRDNILNIVFPQKFSECSPAWGKGCPYKRICFGDVSRPLEQGFEYRKPHHAIEEDASTLEQ